MSRGWKTYHLKDITVKIGSGSTPTGGSGAYKEDGISLIRSQNVLDYKFTKDGLAFIDDDQAYALRGVTVEENDVLLNITGDSVARCCSAPKSWLPARVNQHVAILRSNPDLLNHSFLKYALLAAKEELLILSEIGGTRNALTKGLIEQFKLLLPPLPQQKAIASVLSSLDDKIDLLHRQNKTLEAMAETLFRQWLIEEAKEDWEEVCLGSLFTISSGKGLKREKFNELGSIPILGANGQIGFTDEILFEEHLIYTGRVGTLGKVSIVEGQPVWLSDNTLVFRNVEYFYFTYFHLKTVNYPDYNVGSTQPLIRQSDIKEITILLPLNKDLIKDFEHQTEELFGKIRSNQKQIQTLEKLRDTLLPKLMSGEVRVQYQTEDVA
ncbi:restriction endonuclease subunit S [Acinetobacter sp. WCHAc010034]|uniref:restriction endonuclease subunit S n=1 Tax=Acinetobacter sp. WCHAc010034 TaxID=1879049 RepID=UPI00083A4BC8|nr:restriction endonuclease subunit S [Acinetobacter sp. WCHAc010034]AYA04297.1 restriction endonuclease subunit S [Acinetobacter sp. WCHAc010034]